jgi:hypothetical protein
MGDSNKRSKCIEHHSSGFTYGLFCKCSNMSIFNILWCDGNNNNPLKLLCTWTVKKKEKELSFISVNFLNEISKKSR